MKSYFDGADRRVHAEYSEGARRGGRGLRALRAVRQNYARGADAVHAAKKYTSGTTPPTHSPTTVAIAAPVTPVFAT